MLLIFYTSVLFCAVEPQNYLRTYWVSQCPVGRSTLILSIVSRLSSLSLLHPAITVSNTKHPLLCQLGGRFSVTHREEDLKRHTGMCRMLLCCCLALNSSTLTYIQTLANWWKQYVTGWLARSSVNVLVGQITGCQSWTVSLDKHLLLWLVRRRDVLSDVQKDGWQQIGLSQIKDV